MNRGCKVESYSNKYFPNTSLPKTREPLCLDDNKKRQIAYHGSWQVFLIFFSGRIIQSKTSQLHFCYWSYAMKNDPIQENHQPSYMEIILKTSPTQRFLSFWRNRRNQTTVFVGHLSMSFTT